MSGRDGFGVYRDLLASHGFRPSRRLGQNFLLDPTLHRVLVDAVAPRSKLDEAVRECAEAVAASSDRPEDATGIALGPLNRT